MAEDLFLLRDQGVHAHDRENLSTAVVWFGGMYLVDESKTRSWDRC